MKRIIKLLLSIIIITAVSSCNHSNTLGKMIPSNALGIVHLNGRSLSSKMPWEDIKKSTWFNKIYTDSNTQVWMKKVMENPELSGIDNKGDLVFFIQSTSDGMGRFVFEGDIKDEKSFETYTSNFSAGSLTKDDKLRSSAIRNHGFVAWNNKKFAFVFSKRMPHLKDSASNVQTDPGITDPGIGAYCKNLFSLKEDSSMRNNNNFTTLLNDPSDIHIWQNTEEILKNNASGGVMGMMKLDVFLKNNVSTYSINFEDGNIDVKQRWYASKELMNVLSKYGGGNINTQMIKNIPSSEISALLSLHFKPQGIQELLKLTGMDGLINLFISKQGFNIDDFVSANKGDILLVASDIKINKDSTSDSSVSYHPSAHVLFSASIGDKPSFNKLVAAGKKLGTSMKKDSGIYYAMNDQFFVAGNDLNAVNKFNSGANNTFSFLDEIKDHPLGAYINLNKILSTISSSDTKDNARKPLINAAAKMWDKIIITGGEVEDDAYHIHSRTYLMDKKTNSLKQLSGFLDVLSGMDHHSIWIHHQKDKSDSTHGYMDSATIK